MYMGIFAIMFLIIYLPILLSGKMYIYMDIGADTYCSYWPSLAYAKRLLEDFKLWDMSLGLGTSTIIYLSYFLIDPFNWVVFIFDYAHLDVGIFISLFLKNICVAFFAYRYTGMKKVTGYVQIISSLMIIFSGWFVGWGQHYNFATVYVLFIIILYFFEKWIQHRSYIGLVLSVMILALVSPYYSYMVLLFMVFYYLFLLFYNQKVNKLNAKTLMKHSLQTALIFLTGLSCSAVLFLPYMGDTFASPRVNGKILPSFSLGTVQEYATIFLRTLSNSLVGINTNYCGFSNFYESPFMFIGILGIFLLTTYVIGGTNRKKYLPITILIFAMFSLVNFFGPIFNAFSTKTYRWTFLVIPILATGCGKALQAFNEIKKKQIFFIEGMILLVLLNIYIVWYNKKYGLNQVVIESYILVCLLLVSYMLLLAFFSKFKFFKKILLLMIIVDLAGNAYITVNIRSLLSRSELSSIGYFDGTSDAVEYLRTRDNSFYRISKNYNLVDLNDNMFQGNNGEKIYSSILSAETWSMQELFDLRVPNSNYLYGFDDKQILRNITTGKYRFTKVAASYYGYQFVDKVDEIYIYQNYNCANWGTIYNSYCAKSDVIDMNQMELQNILLHSCIIDDSDLDATLEDSITYKNDYEMPDMSLVNKLSNVNSQECMIELNQDNVNPFVLIIEGLDLKGEIEIFQDDVNGAVDKITCDISDDIKTYYIDNMFIDRINIHGYEGSIISYKLYEIDGDKLTSQMIELNRNHFEITNFSDTNIQGEVDCETPGLLFIPISYNSNWNASINGEPVKIYRANAGFMAIVVPEGRFKIEINYNPKLFVLGGIISGISIIAFILVVLYKNVQKGKNK